jgi:hypothetical protein
MRCFPVLALILSLWPGLLAAQTLGDAADAPPPAATSAPLPLGLFVSPTISTLGVGLEAGVRLNRTFGVRFGGNWLSVDFDRTIDDVDYDADATLASLGTLIDVHPFQGGFRLTGGLRFNFNSADLVGEANDDITIGDQTFAAGDVGTLEGDVGYDVLAPYLGLGYGATLLQGALSVGFDAGVMYQGKADVDLDAQGGALAGDAVLEDNLDLEEEDIEDDLEDYQFYPVVGIAIIYRF